jgi:hypothetical protein
MLYALLDPEEGLIEASIATDKETVWLYGFNHVSAKDREWGSKFWKKWTPSKRSASRMGYKIVRVWITDKESSSEELVNELRRELREKRTLVKEFPEWGVK